VVTLESGIEAWAFGSCRYIQSAICNVEDHLTKAGEKLPYKAPTPLSSGYRPEMRPTSIPLLECYGGLLSWEGLTSMLKC
jgi:hypothetical protein